MSKELYLRKLKPVRKYLRENMTEAETYLWAFLRRKQLGFSFRRQVSIGYFIVDFYCKELGLAIEIDGGIHLQQNVKEHDRLKQEIIESDNVFFLRVSNEDVLKNISETLRKIKTQCKLMQASQV